MNGDFSDQARLLEGVRDRISRIETLDDAVYERLGPDWWVRAMLTEFEWLATLIDQRMLQFKLVQRSYGNSMTGWLGVLSPFLNAHPTEFPQFRALLEQFKKTGEVSFPVPTESGKEPAHV